jgi:hypothetical protein
LCLVLSCLVVALSQQRGERLISALWLSCDCLVFSCVLSRLVSSCLVLSLMLSYVILCLVYILYCKFLLTVLLSFRYRRLYYLHSSERLSSSYFPCMSVYVRLYSYMYANSVVLAHNASACQNGPEQYKRTDKTRQTGRQDESSLVCLPSKKSRCVSWFSLSWSFIS